MIAIDIARDRSLCDAATPGPWTSRRHETLEPYHVHYRPRVFAKDGAIADVMSWISEPDAAFIAAARTGWPQALDRIEELEKELAETTAALDDWREHGTGG